MMRNRFLLGIIGVLLVALAASIGAYYSPPSISPLPPSEAPQSSPSVKEMTTVTHEANLLSVSSLGKAGVNPDRAKISMGILTEAANAREASERNARILSEFLRGMEELGISRDEIQTTGYTVTPVYEYLRDKTPRLVGYRVEHRLTVTLLSGEVDELGRRAGRVIDRVVAAGVNKIYSIYFTVAEDKLEELRSEALRDAVRRAESKAKIIAETLGVRLVRVKSVSEGGYYQPTPRIVGSFEAEKAETELIPGVFEVSTSIQITYEIEG